VKTVVVTPAIVKRGARVRPLLAYCYNCRTWLATWTLDGLPGDLNASLVPRAYRHEATGLPRFGPPRRHGHDSARHAVDWRPRINAAIFGAPDDFYANCPTCGRGQRVSRRASVGGKAGRVTDSR